MSFCLGYGHPQLSAQLITLVNQSLIFLDPFHGAGGVEATGIQYPQGLTIYGRWTTVTPEADSNGGIICYFGK